MSTNTSVQKHTNSLKQEGKRLFNTINTARISPLFETLMRLGYLVRGLIYGMMGILAIQVAVLGRGTLTDSQGVIVTMGKTPIGSGLLYIILAGLIGYALWGIVRAVFDPLHKGHDFKGLAQRAGYAVSAISYGLLALATYGLIAGVTSAARNGAQTSQTQQTTASILSYSWGVAVVGIVAIVLVGGGLLQIAHGLSHDFEEQFDLYALSRNKSKWIERLGRFGTVARGLVFTLIGVFLFLAAYHNDPRQAEGIDGVLTALLHQPFGTLLLGVVALGLLAFGLYSAMCSLWLRFKRSAA